MEDLSTKAIVCLNSGDYLQAASWYRQALDQMRHVLAKICIPNHHNESTVLATRNASDHGVCVQTGPATTSVDTSLNTETTFQLFDRAFAVKARAGPHEISNIEKSCALLYNLALCHTLEWTKNRVETHFTMALQLYRMALSTLDGEPLDQEEFLQRNGSSLLLQPLAIFNNTGYLLNQH